jgi:putative oxidoreductase
MTKTKKIIFYILLVIVTALFLYTSYDKLSGDPMAKAGFAVAHLPVWFMYFIGVCELLGAIGLWIPKLRNWAAGGLFIILAGAVVTTLIFVSVPLAILPLVTAIVLWIVVRLGNKKPMPMQAPSSTETV